MELGCGESGLRSSCVAVRLNCSQAGMKRGWAAARRTAMKPGCIESELR